MESSAGFDLSRVSDAALRRVGKKVVDGSRLDDDAVGSLMIEENVVSAANTTHRTSTAEMERLILDAGFTPVRRRQDYSLIAPAANAA